MGIVVSGYLLLQIEWHIRPLLFSESDLYVSACRAKEFDPKVLIGSAYVDFECNACGTRGARSQRIAGNYANVPFVHAKDTTERHQIPAVARLF